MSNSHVLSNRFDVLERESSRRRKTVSSPRNNGNLTPLRFLYSTLENRSFSFHPDHIIAYDEIPQRSSLPHSCRKRRLFSTSPGTEPSTEKKVLPSSRDNMGGFCCRTIVMNCNDILEIIFSFNDYSDVLMTSLVCRRWFQVGRSNNLWKKFCMKLWDHKLGAPALRYEKSMGLFWRTFLNSDLIEILTVREIKSLFLESPLGRKEIREAFNSCLEVIEMRQVALKYMPNQLGGEDYGMDKERILTTGFHNLWFGSFASSIIDSKRTRLTLDELLSRKGFSLHFKVMSSDHELKSNKTRTPHNDWIRRGQSGGVHLHFFCNCRFMENFDFVIDAENVLSYPTWTWTGETVKVGDYPPLMVNRLDNWGWKLENQNAVLLSN